MKILILMCVANVFGALTQSLWYSGLCISFAYYYIAHQVKIIIFIKQHTFLNQTSQVIEVSLPTSHTVWDV